MQRKEIEVESRPDFFVVVKKEKKREKTIGALFRFLDGRSQSLPLSLSLPVGGRSDSSSFSSRSSSDMLLLVLLCFFVVVALTRRYIFRTVSAL